MSTETSPSEERAPAPHDTAAETAASNVGHQATRTDDDSPRMEPWLWVLLSAFVPGLMTLLLPPTFLGLLLGATGVLIVSGIALFIVQEARNRRARSRSATS